MKRVITIIVFTFVGVYGLSARQHVMSSETAGNYSSFFVGMINRSGLRSGWNSIPDTMGSKSTERVLRATVLVPVAGDITESSTFALGVEIPYLSNKFVQHSREEISRTGIGDITVLGKYGFTFYDEFDFGTRRYTVKGKAAFIGKIKLPQAASETMDGQGVALPYHLQLGSGSTDYALGFAFLTETQNYFMVHGHAVYWLNTTTNGRKAGNSFDYEIMLLLATLPIEAEPVGTFLPMLGIQGMHSAKDRMDEMFVEDSGGDLFVLSLGIQSLWNYVPGWGAFFMVDALYHLPVMQRVNGVQLGYGASFSLGARIYIQ